MAFFESLGNAISDVGKSVSNKASEVVEVNKLNNKISEKKKEISSSYEEIGKLVFEKFKSGVEVEDEFKELCTKLTTFEDELADLNSKLTLAKGAKVCPNCGSTCSSGAKFCNSCGNPFN